MGVMAMSCALYAAALVRWSWHVWTRPVRSRSGGGMIQESWAIAREGKGKDGSEEMRLGIGEWRVASRRSPVQKGREPEAPAVRRRV
jgi:hypothetical protein